MATQQTIVGRASSSGIDFQRIHLVGGCKNLLDG